MKYISHCTDLEVRGHVYHRNTSVTVDFLCQVGSGSCRAVAVVTQYFFLASFSWMLTMAFDVWRTLRLATSELRVSAGKQWRKFAFYSSWTWMAPAVFVAAAVATDCAPKGNRRTRLDCECCHLAGYSAA
jgi:hypothetical protein